MHVDSLDERENDKNVREGEEKYVYFYVRLHDGLMVLQGDMKISRPKVEEYLESLGKRFIQGADFTDIAVRTLLREDFLQEVEKLDQVRLIEVEIKSEVTSSYENEVIVAAKRSAQEFKANYASVVLRSKYKREGLENYLSFLEGLKPRNTNAPVAGVNSIKVIGKQDGEYKRVFLEKVAEKYTRDIETNENNMLKSEDAYLKIIEIGNHREDIWRS